MGNVAKCKICCSEIPDYVLAVGQHTNREEGNAICSRCQNRLGIIQIIKRLAVIMLFIGIGCIFYGVLSVDSSTYAFPLYCRIAILSFYAFWGAVSLSHKKMYISLLIIFFFAYLLFDIIFPSLTGIDVRAFNSVKGISVINFGVFLSLVSSLAWHFFRRMWEIGRLLIESQD